MAGQGENYCRWASEDRAVIQAEVPSISASTSSQLGNDSCSMRALRMAGSPRRAEWEERPLPLAVFEHGRIARERAIAALQQQGIPFRMSYESPSLNGLVSMVEAGLAVAPLALCGLPERLRR